MVCSGYRAVNPRWTEDGQEMQCRGWQALVVRNARELQPEPAAVPRFKAGEKGRNQELCKRWMSRIAGLPSTQSPRETGMVIIT